MYKPEHWNDEILKMFRLPGDFKYQLVQSPLVSLITSPSEVESQWLVDVGSPVELSHTSMFKQNRLSMVQNGAWVLDGTLTPMFEKNIYEVVKSENARREGLPAIWDVSPADDKYWTMSAVPNPKKILTILWDVSLQAYPNTFSVSGLKYDSADPTVVWQINVTANNSTKSEVPLGSYVDTTYDTIRITAKDWPRIDKSLPTLSCVYCGLSSDNAFKKTRIAQVEKQTSIDLSSNQLSASTIDIDISNLNRLRNPDEDLLLEKEVPGNTVLYSLFGQMYSNGVVKYLAPFIYKVSEYTAPTDTQSIKISGKDFLQDALQEFKFNYVPKISEKFLLEEIINMMLLTIGDLKIDTSIWPSEIFDPTYATQSVGALPRGTTINQALQYVTQLIGAVAFSDPYSPMLYVKRVADLVDNDREVLSNDCQTSWPAIKLNTQINCIKVKIYHVANEGKDLYKPIYVGTIKVPKGKYDSSTAQWSSYTCRIKWPDILLDTTQPYRITLTHADDVTTAFDYEVLHIWHDYVELRIIWKSEVDEGMLELNVIGYPDTHTIRSFKVTPETTDEFTIEVTRDKPMRGAYFSGWDDSVLEMVQGNAGAYCARGIFKPLQIGVTSTIELVADDVEVTEEVYTYWDDSANEPGETVTIDNPLVSSVALANKVGAFIKMLAFSRKTYQLSYLGDPALQAAASREVITDYETINPMIITQADIQYNGGYSGTISGRKL